MAAGDITGELDKKSFIGTPNGNNFITKISDDIIVVVEMRHIISFAVDGDGYMTYQHAYNFSSFPSTYPGKLIHIHDNVYAFAVSLSNTSSYVMTFDISSSGIITKIHEHKFSTEFGMMQSMTRVHGDVYAISHKFLNNAYVTTVNINSSGTLISSIDNGFVGSGYSNDYLIIKVSDTVFAVVWTVYATGTHIYTIHIQHDGTIGSFIDSINIAGRSMPVIKHIHGDVYAVTSYESSNWLNTISISSTGALQLLHTSTPISIGRRHDIEHVAKDVYAITCGTGTGTGVYLHVTTVVISNNGDIYDSYIDTESYQGGGVNPSIIHVKGCIYAAAGFFYGNGMIHTIGIDTPSGTISRRHLFTGGLSHRAIR